MWLKTLKTTSLIIEKYYNYLFIFLSNNGIGSNLLNYLFLVLYNSLKPPLISLYLKLKHYSTVHPPPLYAIVVCFLTHFKTVKHKD